MKHSCLDSSFSSDVGLILERNAIKSPSVPTEVGRHSAFETLLLSTMCMNWFSISKITEHFAEAHETLPPSNLTYDVSFANRENFSLSLSLENEIDGDVEIPK